MHNELSKLGILRDIAPQEIEMMLGWRNTPHIRQNMYTRHEISLDEHLAWWERTKTRVDQKYFMYEYNGIPSGIVSLNNIDLENRNSMWAFYSSPDAPRGTGGRMEYLALDYAFFQINLNKLCCEVLEFNNAVIKLHEKFGFVIEGVLRDQHRMDDTFVDVYRLGILACDWEAKREAMFQKLTMYRRPG